MPTSEYGHIHQYLDGQSTIEEPEKREITLNSKSARRYEDQGDQSNLSSQMDVMKQEEVSEMSIKESNAEILLARNDSAIPGKSPP